MDQLSWRDTRTTQITPVDHHGKGVAKAKRTATAKAKAAALKAAREENARALSAKKALKKKARAFCAEGRGSSSDHGSGMGCEFVNRCRHTHKHTRTHKQTCTHAHTHARTHKHVDHLALFAFFLLRFPLFAPLSPVLTGKRLVQSHPVVGWGWAGLTNRAKTVPSRRGDQAAI